MRYCLYCGQKRLDKHMLKCTKCCEAKQPHELSARSCSANGRQYVCRTCQSVYKKQACKGKSDAVRPAERPAEQLYLLSYPWPSSPIKVGRTHDVSARVGQLEGGHNFRLQLLAVCPGQGRLEHNVHALLSSYRATSGRGQEWFQVTLAQALSAVAMAIATAYVHSGPPADPAQ